MIGNIVARVLVKPRDFRYGETYAIADEEWTWKEGNTTGVLIIGEASYGHNQTASGLMGRANFKTILDKYPEDFVIVTGPGGPRKYVAVAFRPEDEANPNIQKVLKALGRNTSSSMSRQPILDLDLYDHIKYQQLKHTITDDIEELSELIVYPVVSTLMVGYGDNIRVQRNITQIEEWPEIASDVLMTALEGLRKKDFSLVRYEPTTGAAFIRVKDTQNALREQDEEDLQEWFAPALEALQELEPPPLI